jgi:hypothetical protein
MNEFELLRDLRALRQPAMPATDAWPAIAARIAAPVAVTPAPRRAMWPEALAASMVLGLGVLLAISTGDRLQGPTGDSPAAVSAELPWSLREALALDAAYAGALEEARRSAPPAARELVHAEREIDAAQRALEDALAEQPDAVHLLDLLRRTHEQRLRLAQRHARIG